ncbi:hypothetical protein FM106_16415 [Brachybacterium faecium]|nr:hypothetical protein FM106_16415 [Brachybacterium faecium]
MIIAVVYYYFLASSEQQQTFKADCCNSSVFMLYLVCKV